MLHIHRRDERACYLIFGVFVVEKESDSKDHEDGGSKLFRSVGKYLKIIIMMMMMIKMMMMMMIMMIIIIIIIGPGYLSRYGDSLRAERSGDRIPVWAIFSAAVQTGPWGPPSLS